MFCSLRIGSYGKDGKGFHVSLFISMQGCFHCNHPFSKKWKQAVIL